MSPSNKRPIWVHSRPTQEGWYWMSRDCQELEMVEARYGLNGKLFILIHAQAYCTTAEDLPKKTMFSGPLKQPYLPPPGKGG